MKRISSILLALLLSTAVLASCGKNNETKETNAAETNAPETSVTETSVTETEAPETNAAEESTTALDAKAALEGLFDEFHNKLAPAYGVESGEEIKGAYVGTDMETITETDPESGETFTYEMPKAAPSTIDLTSEESYIHATYFPADQIANLDSAAFFMNMMNANVNGTFSAFEVKEGADVAAIAAALKEALANNMWMCGAPDGFYIVEVNGVILSGFGGTDPLNAFKEAIAATYANANVLYDESLIG